MSGAETTLPEPCPKENPTFPKKFPFPLLPDCETLIDGIAVDPLLMVGYLKNNCVYVTEQAHIRKIYSMGFFGNGTLSNGAPGICDLPDSPESPDPSPKPSTCPSACSSPCSSTIDVVKDASKTESDEEIEVVECDEVKKKEPELIVLSDSSDGSADEHQDTSDCVVTYENVRHRYDSDDSNKKSQSPEEPEDEQLELTFQEAFFLSHVLECLAVMENNENYDSLKLWQRFCHLSHNFPAMYSAYHHFRRKGWIVRSGLKYGTDYVLYKEGPPFYHATYAVIVKSVQGDTMTETGSKGPLTWAALAAIERVCAQSGKGLMFLYVIAPSTLSESTPACISEFEMQEILMKRWVASENREDDLPNLKSVSITH